MPWPIRPRNFQNRQGGVHQNQMESGSWNFCFAEERTSCWKAGKIFLNPKSSGGSFLSGWSYSSPFPTSLGTDRRPMTGRTVHVWASGDFVLASFPVLAPLLGRVGAHSLSGADVDIAARSSACAQTPAGIQYGTESEVVLCSREAWARSSCRLHTERFSSKKTHPTAYAAAGGHPDENA